MNKKTMAKIVEISKEQKQDFATHKVQLSFKDDIQKFVDEVFEEIDYNEGLNKAMDASWVNARNAIEDLVEKTDAVKNHLPNLNVKPDGTVLKNKIKQAAAELGVKPEAVKGYDDIDTAISEANKQLQDAKVNIKDSKPPKGN
jgi:urate oxidase